MEMRRSQRSVEYERRRNAARRSVRRMFVYKELSRGLNIVVRDGWIDRRAADRVRRKFIVHMLEKVKSRPISNNMRYQKVFDPGNSKSLDKISPGLLPNFSHTVIPTVGRAFHVEVTPDRRVRIVEKEMYPE
ncbi:MAG: hypothetical protein JXB14_04525 [Candidatus Altiarchaeota archaeon]|nr:hypothetical protein [Candidatus Altiarchaeota archaeon]